MKSALIVTALTFLHADGHAQSPIRVVLGVTDPTNGVLESFFARELRAVGDLAIVTDLAEADFEISVVALCDDDVDDDESCNDPDGYIASTVVLSIWHGVYGDPATDVSGSDAEVMVTHFVSQWGCNRYEQGIRELIATVDARCFERHRTFLRIMESSASPISRAEQFLAAIEGKNYWLC